MAANSKRLDLRFGSFACSVQGFEDPVLPVQQILRAIQHLLEETPELADAGISFDAEAIESLIEEVARRADLVAEDIEVTPGLVIVHRGENAPAPAFYADAAGDQDEGWARPFTEGAEEAEKEPGYVNIFAQRGGNGAADAEQADEADDAEASAEEAEALFARRLGGGGAPAAAARDIFAETGGSADGSVFADPMSAADRATAPAAEAEDEEDEEDEEEALNLFAPSGRSTGALAAAVEDEADTGGSLFGAGANEPEDADETEDVRVQALFGDSEDQPETEGGSDGYTAGGLARAAAATALPDLMASAAAWLVLLRGQTNFTRREVLDVFDQIPGEHEKSLQARITGFGKAVRNGQIVMVEDGVFALSQTEHDRFEALL